MASASRSSASIITESLARVFNEELSCPICLEELKEPKCLPECAHNVCKACLESMAGETPEVIRCPICRQDSQIPRGGVRALPTNTVLIRLLEATPGRQERLDVEKSLDKRKPVVEEMREKRLNGKDLMHIPTTSPQLRRTR